MPEINNKKICIIVSSLGKGGAERSSALISRMLSNLGYEIHIISVLNIIDYQFSGTLLNLGELKDKNDNIIGKLKRIQVLKNYILNQKFNLIIDSRSRPKSIKELIFKFFIYNNQNVVYIVHSSNLKTYLSESKFIFNIIYGRAKAIICVSSEIKKLIEKKYKIDKVFTVYNAVDNSENILLSTIKIKLDFDYILFYGRLEDDVKNISLLLDAYKISKLKSNMVKLLILGEGKDKLKLMRKVMQLNLNEDVKFVPFTSNPFAYIKNSKFVVLSSRYEGFPMIIPESLSVGVPVISVDCISGPNEIIQTGYNGLLVENFNEKALADALNSFIFDKNLYQVCKKNSQDSVKKFSLENISKEWDKMLNELL